MKINNKNINEYNIEDYINERSEKSFSEIFLELKKDVQEKVKSEKYSSLPSNYTPIFLYHVINKNIDNEELNIVLQLSENYEYGLHRFFDSPDVNFDEKKSLWEELNYFFYKTENDQVVIDENKIKYIEIFCNNVREKNLLDFHSSRIDFFISKYIYKHPEYISIFSNYVEKNELLQKGEHFQFSSSQRNILKIFADSSYDLDIQEIYKEIKKDKFLSQFIQKGLIELDYNKKYKSNLSFVQMVSKYDEDFLFMFQERVKEIKPELSEKQFTELLYDCNYSMDDMMKNKNVILDVSKINLEEDFRLNIPFILFLKGKVENNATENIINISENFIQYMKENFEKLNKEIKDDYDFEDLMLMKRLELEKVFKYLEYKRLDNKLDNNKPIERKVKI